MQKSFQDLLRKQEGDRAMWEYPFAVAGVNITFMLIQMLDLEAGFILCHFIPASSGVSLLPLLNLVIKTFVNSCFAFAASLFVNEVVVFLRWGCNW